MKLVVTIYEATCDAAIDAIQALRAEHDMIEVRAERFPAIDLQAIRAATPKPIILTYRSVGGRRLAVGGSMQDALAAGIDFVDVEWGNPVEVPERTVLSHHDYDGMANVERIMASMRACGCAHTKLAATPKSFAENEVLLRLLPPTADRQPFDSAQGGPPTDTVIGMGERGLYSRILGPFLGSELAFVAADDVAAPGQLTLDRALEIYGREPRRAERVFAIAGNPAGHSLSPVIHNRLFREKGVPAAYTIASIERFDEIADAFSRGEPCGLSVTTPFKEDAFVFAANVAENARRARAVNTLVNVNGTILADNTDVDGFAALIGGRVSRPPLPGILSGSTASDETPAAGGGDARRPRNAAVLGAGPTARAALVALEDARIPAIVYNRANMHTLRDFHGDLIINTLPPDAEVRIPRCKRYIEAAYSGPPRDVDAEVRIGGIELLHAQAVRQHQLFMKVFDGI